MSTEYLSVMEFSSDALASRMLNHAFRVGWIDRLLREQHVQRSALQETDQLDEKGAEYLLSILQQYRICSMNGGEVSLTDRFRDCCRFRDLLQVKLDFAELVVGDFIERLPELLRSESEFQQQARLFRMFDYGRCLEVTPENCLHASRWMRLTTMLSRYEGPACCDYYDFGKHRQMLDLGGNSGEFAVQICRRCPQLRAVVMDLPVVCHVGRQHLRSEPESQRIEFMAGNMHTEPLPADSDLITWKSVLHDWPDAAVPGLFRKAWKALPEGGSVVIFERQKWDARDAPLSYGDLPTSLFFRSYRDPAVYQCWLQEAGFRQVQLQTISLEVPFLLLSAIR